MGFKTEEGKNCKLPHEQQESPGPNGCGSKVVAAEK